MRTRTLAPEIMDSVVADVKQLDDSFREVWGVNRYLGGMAVLKHHLAPWLDRNRVTLVDVAAGTGDVTCALIDWAGERQVRVAATMVDNHPQVLAIAAERTAREGAVTLMPGDARRLPFPDGAFDLAVCNLALHHFDEGEAAVVLREMDRVSRLGWVVSDLERHPLAYAAARVLSLAVWRNPITRHDGPLSVRRAYTAREAAALVSQAGVAARVCRHFPFRLAIVCRKG